MPRLEFDVFGRRVLVERTSTGWRALYPGPEGKARVAHDIVIPADTPEVELRQYLADFCHEWGSPERPDVHRPT
jgi:hypothetical protein